MCHISHLLTCHRLIVQINIVYKKEILKNEIKTQNAKLFYTFKSWKSHTGNNFAYEVYAFN